VQHLYGRVVTYEEPLLTWSGELEPANGRNPNLKWAIRAKLQAFTMPENTGIEPNAGVLLENTLQAYHAQSGGTRFRVLSSELGYHLVPEQVHDETGHLAPAHSVLDARITVPTETRTPRQHLLALLNAVTTANTVKVSPVIAGKPTGFDTVFRATPAQFPWGADGVVARDALIDLLKRSSTTMIWHLLCQPSAKAEDRACGLNMSMLEVTVTGAHGIPANRVLRFDRCGDCPPLAPPAAPPQPLK
jgi:hypothetical protein